MAIERRKIAFEIELSSNTKNLEHQTVTELNQKNLKYIDKDLEAK